MCKIVGFQKIIWHNTRRSTKGEMDTDLFIFTKLWFYIYIYIYIYKIEFKLYSIFKPFNRILVHHIFFYRIIYYIYKHNHDNKGFLNNNHYHQISDLQKYLYIYIYE